MTTCACGMPRKPQEGLPAPFGYEWHAEHQRRHLEAFPGADEITRANLAEFVAQAAASEGR